jgi:hypothetical protein
MTQRIIFFHFPSKSQRSENRRVYRLVCSPSTSRCTPSSALISNRMAAAQDAGCYPRVNGKMLQSGQYNGLIVSLVGRYESLNMNGSNLPFKAADDTLVNINVKEVEPELLPVSTGPTSPVMEIVGLVESSTQVLVSGLLPIASALRSRKPQGSGPSFACVRCCSGHPVIAFSQSFFY